MTFYLTETMDSLVGSLEKHGVPGDGETFSVGRVAGALRLKLQAGAL